LHWLHLKSRRFEQTRNRRGRLQKTDCRKKSNLADGWVLDLHARSRDPKLTRFPPGLLLHLQVLRVQREVLVTAAVPQCVHGHRRPQGSGHGFVPGGTQ
jgi:hypothetical protein